MGRSMDFFKSAVASAIAKGSSFPYTFHDRVDLDESIWTLHNAVRKEDNSACSVFTFDITTNKSRQPLARNAARKFRTLRHPGVMRIVETIETETNIYIITERVTPLSWHVKRKSLSQETAKWGLFSIASTLKFINEDATSVHGLVRVSSIYTSESGEWKLGGLDILSSMKEDDAVIYNYGSLVPDSARYAPPEVTNNGWPSIKKHPLPAVDAYDYGILIFEVFNGSFRGSDQIGNTKNIPPSMHQSYKRLLNANAKLRLSPGHFLDLGRKSGSFFETPLIRLSQGVESLGLKDESEREEFLSELDELSDDFPEDFFKMKVLPELLKSVEFGGGGPKVFTAILKIGSKLSEDEFEAKLLPVIIRLFASPDRVMRVCLLENLPKMIDRLPPKVVNGKIFPNIATGFSDTAPLVREQTVMSVLTVIDKLSDRIINGDLLKQLAKTANDEQPGIRTNTTICLGKIAKNLGVNSRSKVLVAAFTRSLRDPFVHARNAALLALNATIEMFSEEDCATKLLPAISPSLIDKEKLVRDQANKTLESYLQRVKKYGATLGETSVIASEAADGSNSTRIGNQSDSSWAGWAISSFTNKMSTARGDIQPATNGVKNSNQTTLRPNSVPPRQATPTSTMASEKPTRTIAASSSTTDLPSQTQALDEPGLEEDDVLDAWGTMDDEGDSFFDAPATKKVSQPSPAVAFEDGGEPDFAGWLAAQSQAKAKRPLPKGLSKPSQGSTTTTTRPPASSRTVTTGSIGSTAGATRLSSTTSKPGVTKPVKKIDLKPKEPEATDDDWGSAWD